MNLFTPIPDRETSMNVSDCGYVKIRRGSVSKLGGAI